MAVRNPAPPVSVAWLLKVSDGRETIIRRRIETEVLYLEALQ